MSCYQISLALTCVKIIRKKHHYPIIMLTAKSEEIDKITGLTIGADDYNHQSPFVRWK